MPTLLFLTGSLRAASSSRAVAQALMDHIGERASCETADIGALPHYNADLQNDAGVTALTNSIGRADGVVFVTPEYNYSIPGVLKNAIDWASRPAYDSVFRNKPCFIVTVSGGATGGIRAQSHLKYILNGMLARPHVDKEIVVPFANAKTQGGTFADADIMAFAGSQMDDFLQGVSA